MLVFSVRGTSREAGPPGGEFLASSDEGELAEDIPTAHIQGTVRLEELLPEGADLRGQDGQPSLVNLEAPTESCVIVAWQRAQPVAAPAACDDLGRFSLDLDPGIQGTVAVELSIAGRLRGLVEVEVESGVTSTLPTVALGLGLPLRGRVVDSRGGAISGVSLQAMPVPNLGESEPWRARSRDDGSFAFETLPFGRVNLRATKAGYTMSVVETIAPESEVSVVLGGLIDLEGRVVGAPLLLARARVRLEGSSLWPPIEKKIEADGRFVFEGMPDGIYAMEVLVSGKDTTGEGEWASLPLENITPDLHIDVALVPAHRIAVQVVDPFGVPVSQARVTLGNSSVGLLQKYSKTGPDGRSSVGPVVPGFYSIRADADGFLPADALEVQVAAQAPEEQRLVLVRPGKIMGVVVDAGGHPVAGATIALEGAGQLALGENDARAHLFGLVAGGTSAGLGGSLGTTKSVPEIPAFGLEDFAPAGIESDAFGKFQIEMLRPGTYRLRAFHGEHAASATLTVSLESGQTNSATRLQLRSGTSLSGVVRTSNGRPVAYARLEFDDGLQLVADERGSFDAGLRRGRQRMVVRAPGMIPTAVQVKMASRATDLAVVLEIADGQIEGRVRDGNGQAIENVEVGLRHLDGLSPSALEWTDERGIFSLRRLAPGLARLSFAHADYVDLEASIRIDTVGDPQEFRLSGGWTLEVTVRSAVRGDPIVGAVIQAAGRHCRTSNTGGCHLEHLSGGDSERLKVEVNAEGWVTQFSTVSGDGSARVQKRFDLEEAGGLEGTLVDELGAVVAGATVVALEAVNGRELGRVVTSALGRFRLEGLRAGEVLIHVAAPRALSAVLAPIRASSDVRRGMLTRELHLRFNRL